MNSKNAIIVLTHAFAAWGLCGAIIGIGRNVTSMEITLRLHAIGAPVFFAIMALIYFRNFNYTSPLQTAVIFVSFAILTFLLIPYINTKFVFKIEDR